MCEVTCWHPLILQAWHPGGHTAQLCSPAIALSFSCLCLFTPSCCWASLLRAFTVGVPRPVRNHRLKKLLV